MRKRSSRDGCDGARDGAGDGEFLGALAKQGKRYILCCAARCYWKAELQPQKVGLRIEIHLMSALRALSKTRDGDDVAPETDAQTEQNESMQTSSSRWRNIP